MSDLTDKIRAAQRDAAENTVIADLYANGLGCAAGVDACPCAVATLMCAAEEDAKLQAARAALAEARAVLQDPKRWMAWCDEKMLEDNEKLRAEVAHLRSLATCGCGDEFTVADPGTCGNCMAAEGAGLRAEVAHWKEARESAMFAAESMKAELYDLRIRVQERDANHEPLKAEIDALRIAPTAK